jgi:hypothetical protein
VKILTAHKIWQPISKESRRDIAFSFGVQFAARVAAESFADKTLIIAMENVQLEPSDD